MCVCVIGYICMVLYELYGLHTASFPYRLSYSRNVLYNAYKSHTAHTDVVTPPVEPYSHTAPYSAL